MLGNAILEKRKIREIIIFEKKKKKGEYDRIWHRWVNNFGRQSLIRHIVILSVHCMDQFRAVNNGNDDGSMSAR